MSYQTDINAADETGTAIQRISGDVNQGVEDLMQYAHQHLNEWTGDAKDSYFLVETQWRQAQGEMGSALAQAQVALAKIHEEIARGEMVGRRTWTGTPVGFGVIAYCSRMPVPGRPERPGTGNDGAHDTDFIRTLTDGEAKAGT